MYEFYPQHPIHFVDILANPPNKLTFSRVPPFMFIIFRLLVLCILKFVFFPKYCKYILVPSVSYGTWNSISVNLFANKHDYTINKEWRQGAISFRLQKEISCLSNLDGAVLGFKFKRFYITAATFISVSSIGFSNCFI